MKTTYRVAPGDVFNVKGNPWVHMPEAVPPARARLRNDASADEAFVTIDEQGQMEYDSDLVQVEVQDE